MAILGSVLGITIGGLVFLVGVGLASWNPGAGAVALGALFAAAAALLAGLSAVGVALPGASRSAGVTLLFFAALHLLAFGLVGAWVAALPASFLLFPAGILMLAAEQ